MLTPYQERLLKLKVSGKTNFEIAREVRSQRTTVVTNFQKIFAKLGCQFSSSDNRVGRRLLIEKAYNDYIKKRQPPELSSTTSQLIENELNKELTKPPEEV